MALTGAQLRYQVRLKSSDDETMLPDAVINLYAGLDPDSPYILNVYDAGVDLYGVLADVWEYLGRDERYISSATGQVAVSRPIALMKSAHYLSLSRRGAAGSISVGEWRRGDLVPPYGIVAVTGVAGVGGEYGI